MANNWIKIEQGTPDKTEMVRMAALLKIDQDAVVGKLLRLWLWADQNTVDGAEMAVNAAFIDRLTNRRGFAAALRAAGWLHGEDDALTFVNFTRHNGTTAKARAMENRKKASQRERDETPPDDDNSPPDCPDDNGTDDGTKTGTRGRGRGRIRENTSNLAPTEPGAPAAPPAQTLTLLPSPAPEPPPRARNPLLDALVAATGSDPRQVTPSAWPGIAKALAEIRSVCPTLDTAEIHRRAAHYRAHMAGAACTPFALAKHWALCDEPPQRTEATRGAALFA